MVNPQLGGLTSDDKLWAGLSYAGLVCCMVPTIVIFLMKKDESQHIKFHGLQAIFFWLIMFVLGVILAVGSHIPVIGLLAGILQIVLTLGYLGIWIFLMIQAFTGKDFHIPVLGDMIDQNLMG